MDSYVRIAARLLTYDEMLQLPAPGLTSQSKTGSAVGDIAFKGEFEKRLADGGGLFDALPQE
ncbi:hypothetical protein CU560_02575 [Serratia ureilytica]|nr:hypothetical protein CU560_02575 [Serratia ureilytica]